MPSKTNIISSKANSEVYRQFITILLVIICTLIGLFVLFIILKVDPYVAFSTLFQGAFGSVNRISETLVMAIPLILVGLCISVAFRAHLWNLGAEGQLYIGAIISAILGISVTGLHPALLILLCMGSSMLAGALWGIIPAVLKTRFGANEVLVTLMLNYVAILLSDMVIGGPLAHGTMPRTISIQPSAFLPTIIPHSRLHIGIFIVLIVMVVVYILLFKTVLGYRIRAMGFSMRAAKYAGININWIMVLALSISGAIAGIAGSIQVLGVQHSLIVGLSPGYGFTGIVVALLGGLHPFGIVVSGIIMAGLFVGFQTVQIVTHIPVAAVHIIQGALVLVFLGTGILRLKGK